METLRNFIVQCLHDYAHDEPGFLRELDRLASREGGRVYPILLNILTALDFDIQEAKSNWEGILAHQAKMTETLGRPVGLATVICDYFSTVNKTFYNPKVIEMMTFEETAHSSSFDGLTGLYNRIYFEKALAQELKRANRYDMEFSLVFFDLDRFKKLNDSLGHQAGDHALKNVAKVILSQKRAEDTAARYGGEELVLILPQTPKVRALFIAERIRQRVDEMSLTHEGHTFDLTLSGGVASFPTDARDLNRLIECADKALYLAKGKGRNRVALYTMDKRRYTRVDFSGEVQVSLPEPPHTNYKAQGKNLSPSGILFESEELVPIGTQVVVRIHFSATENPLVVTGKVVRVEAYESSYDIGVSFLQTSETETSELARNLARHLGISPSQFPVKN